MSPTDPALVARELIPVWVPWTNLVLWPGLAACTALIATFVASRVAFRLAGPPRGTSWAEDAARAWPVRRALGLALVLSVALPTALAGRFHGVVSPVPIVLWTALVAAAAFAGTRPVLCDVSRRLRDPAPRRGFRNLLVGLSLFWPQIVVLALLLGCLPWEWNATALAMLVAAVFTSWAAARGAGVRLLHLVGIARPAEGRLRTIVDETAERVGVAPSEVWEIDCGLPNAFVFPLSGRVCFTTRALEVLDDHRARAICAHELGHLQESTLVKSLRLASVLVILPLGAAPAIAVTMGARAVAALVLAVVLALAATARLRRRMEARADVVARVHESEEGVYAAALEKLYEAARLPMVLGGKGSVHGHLYDRMAAAGAPPPYERPAAPPRGPLLAGVAAAVVALIVIDTGLLVSFRIVAFRAGATESGRLFDIAVHGGRAADFGHLAGLRLAEGRTGESIRLYGAATALDAGSVFYPAQQALLLVSERRCDEAARALAEAWIRSPDDEPVDALVEIADEAMRGSCANQPSPSG